MRRLPLTLGLGLLVSTLLALPAGAEGDPSADHSPPTDIAQPSDAAQPTDVAPAPERPEVDRPDTRPEIERLHLECKGRTTDTGRAAIACAWRPATSDAAAGYVLVRTHGDRETVVFRTDDIGTTGYVDADIRVGVTYGYRLVAISAEGARVGLSAWVRAGVEAPERDIEALKIGCEPIVADDGGKGAFCRWSAAEHPEAVGYQLWRLLSTDDARELIVRTGLDTTSHADRVGDDVRFAWYVVVAVDAEGEIVGRSRAAKVAFGPDEPRVIDPKPTDRVPTDRLPTDRVATDRVSIDVAATSGADGRHELPGSRVIRSGLRLVF